MPHRLFLSRGLRTGLVALMVAAGACAWAPKAPADADDEAEATKEFQDTVKSDSKRIDGMIAETNAGKNISDFRMGMFMMSVLNDLSDRDPQLGAYFHKNGRMMQSYLTDVFQYHSEDEVAHVKAMTSEGKKAARESAVHALEVLRHIPEEKDPPADQEKDRKALAEQLGALKTTLNQAARE